MLFNTSQSGGHSDVDDAVAAAASSPTEHLMIDAHNEDQNHHYRHQSGAHDNTPLFAGALPQTHRQSFDDTTVATWSEYLTSWRFLELLLCCVPLIMGTILEITFEPHQRPIPYQYLESTGDYIVNQMFNEVLKGETVPTMILMVVSGWLPCLLQMLLAWCIPQLCSSKHHRWDVLHKTLCVYTMGLGTTIMVTDALKLYVGYLRPIFYDQCQPNDTYDECQTDDDRQIRLSFPSGHASLSVCGMLLFSNYLEQCFGAYRHCHKFQQWNAATNNVHHQVEGSELAEQQLPIRDLQ
jgi:PAP2 superfamily